MPKSKPAAVPGGRSACRPVWLIGPEQSAGRGAVWEIPGGHPDLTDEEQNHGRAPADGVHVGRPRLIGTSSFKEWTAQKIPGIGIRQWRM
ncbi:hypothetical protein [Paenibacillus sp. 1P03SA]|uniref:hypothetical protein n=1 Tax=Paenibacillus sp. 1P03SA TaxID=3132294 RepID=UPI0039A1747B